MFVCENVCPFFDMNRNVSTAIILDKRKIRKDKKYMVRLRVTHERIQKYYSTVFVLTEKEYDDVMSLKPKGEFKDIKLKLSLIEEHARDIIKNMPEFSFDVFDKLFKNPRGTITLESYYDSYISELRKEGRAGTVQNYQSSINSFKSFSTKKQLQFKDITPAFLFQYGNWMLREGNSISTVGIYIRPLRAIFNMAIREKAISEVIYPFGKDKYQIPAGRNIKKALNLSDIERIYNYPSIPYSAEDRAKDIWFFSYLCNGINVKDICRLKYSNINFSDGSILFIRAKTERTKRSNIKPIVGILTEEVKTIIDKWGNKPMLPHSYVFPLLSEGLNPEEEFARIRQVAKTINKYMKRLAEELNMKLPITTYTARHSYSTILKQSGASIEYISESLGHSDLKTTENYLDSFDLDSKRDIAKRLLDFKK
jgi:integrase